MLDKVVGLECDTDTDTNRTDIDRERPTDRLTFLIISDLLHVVFQGLVSKTGKKPETGLD